VLTHDAHSLPDLKGRGFPRKINEQEKTRYSKQYHRAEQEAKHEYHIEDRFEAGMSLLGWEVKSMRAGKTQLTTLTCC